MSSNKSTIWRLLSFTTFKIGIESSRADPDLRRIITLTNTLDVNLNRLDLMEEAPRSYLLQTTAAMSADDPHSSGSFSDATESDHLNTSDDWQDLYTEDSHRHHVTKQASERFAILHAGDILIQETPPRFLQSCRGSHLSKSDLNSTMTDRYDRSTLSSINPPGSRRRRQR